MHSESLLMGDSQTSHSTTQSGTYRMVVRTWQVTFEGEGIILLRNEEFPKTVIEISSNHSEVFGFIIQKRIHRGGLGQKVLTLRSAVVRTVMSPFPSLFIVNDYQSLS